MRILVEAFACQPNAGSETGYSWHYPLELARRSHDVTVVTTERRRAEIEAAVRGGSSMPRFVFVLRRTWPLRTGLGRTVGSAIQSWAPSAWTASWTWRCRRVPGRQENG